jgi:hypothetical protein
MGICRAGGGLPGGLQGPWPLPNTVSNSYGYQLRKVLLPFYEREGIGGLGGLTNRALDRLAGG